MARSGRLLLSILGAFTIATAGVAGTAAAPPKPSANPDAPAPALPWAVTLTANASAVLPGTIVTVTATANQDVGPTPYFIIIKDNTGTILNRCSIGTTCSAPVMYPTPTVQSFLAIIGDYAGTAPQALSDVISVSWTATTYHAVTPTRILDTRSGTGLSGPSSSHVARTFQVTGGVVPTGATAVTGNLTVTGQTSNGYLFLGPVATNNPTSSTLNFPVGDDRANGVTVALSTGGTLSVTFVAPNPGPTAHVIFDVTGYFVPDSSGATYVPMEMRILDTRIGAGYSGLSGPSISHVARTFQLIGPGPVSPIDPVAIAVTGNLTATAQTGPGYLYLGPAAMNNPTSSTLNFPVGDDRANGVAVPLGAGGSLSVTYVAPNPGPTTHVILDVTGYFVPGTSVAKYQPLAPARILDTRNGTGLSGPSSSHAARAFHVTGNGGVPANAIAVTGNLTVTGQTSNGYLFLGFLAENDPTSSTLNFPVGDDRANGVTVGLSAGGNLFVTFVAPNPGPTTHVIFDVTGYFVR